MPHFPNIGLAGIFIRRAIRIIKSCASDGGLRQQQGYRYQGVFPGPDTPDGHPGWRRGVSPLSQRRRESTETSRSESTSNRTVRKCISQPSGSKKIQKRPKKTELCSLGEEDPCEKKQSVLLNRLNSRTFRLTMPPGNNPPSTRACTRQAHLRNSQSRLLYRDRSPKSSSYLGPQLAGRHPARSGNLAVRVRSHARLYVLSALSTPSTSGHTGPRRGGRAKVFLR